MLPSDAKGLETGQDAAGSSEKRFFSHILIPSYLLIQQDLQ